MQIFFEFMVFKKLHHSKAIHFFFLVKWNKGEVFRTFSNIFKGAFHFIKIMGSNRGPFPGSTKSGMKFFLSLDERFVGFVIEFEIPKDCSYNKRPNLLNLNHKNFTEGSTVMEVVGFDNFITGVSNLFMYIFKILVRASSVNKSGLLFWHSNFQNDLTTVFSLSSYF